MTVSQAGAPHRRRGLAIAGAQGSGLPSPAGSVGAREAPGGPGKPGCCGALMKKVTRGWGSVGVGHLDSYHGEANSQLERGCGGEACVVAAVVTY